MREALAWLGTVDQLALDLEDVRSLERAGAAVEA